MTYALALIPLLVWTTTAWVFIDAGRRDLSDSIFSARWSWTLGVIALWIAFFPLYLTDRAACQRTSQTRRRYPLGRGQWTSVPTEDDVPGEDLLALWEGVDPADMDRITRRALKRAGRES